MHKRIVDVFTTHARELRQNATFSEKKLWKWIRNNQTGYKFRRQHVIGRYIVDFYCDKLKLVIELDGITHDDKETQEHDALRQNSLKRNGYHVVRYIDWVVVYQIESVVQDIINTCEDLEKRSNFIG